MGRQTNKEADVLAGEAREGAEVSRRNRAANNAREAGQVWSSEMLRRQNRGIRWLLESDDRAAHCVRAWC